MDLLLLIPAGLVTGIGLIAAVGAQNAYLLRRGLRREHVGALVAFCAVSDVLIIGASVVGVGSAMQAWPAFADVAKWGGASFLLAYGLWSLLRSVRPGKGLEARGGTPVGRRKALATMAAMTWLNPHLYLDTIMLGTLANSYGHTGRWAFFIGLILASITWFSTVGFGAARLAPLFSRPRAWQVLDAGVGVVMLLLAAGLIFGG